MWLRWAILIGIAYLIYRLLKARGRRRGVTVERGDSTGEEVMVQDPWCKTFVPRSQALKEGCGSEALYFCSQECKDRFLGQKSENDGQLRKSGG